MTAFCRGGGGGGIPVCLAGGIPACLADLRGEWYPGVWPGGSPGPHPGGKLRGLAWKVLQVHTQGGSWGVWPTPGGLQVHTQGVSRSTPGGVSQHALRQTPPSRRLLFACGTHPTGMHSFFECISRTRRIISHWFCAAMVFWIRMFCTVNRDYRTSCCKWFTRFRSVQGKDRTLPFQTLIDAGTI